MLTNPTGRTRTDQGEVGTGPPPVDRDFGKGWGVSIAQPSAFVIPNSNDFFNGEIIL